MWRVLLALLLLVLVSQAAIAQVSNPYFPSQVGWAWTYVAYTGAENVSEIVGHTTIMGREVYTTRGLTQGEESYRSIAANGDVLYHGYMAASVGSYFDPPIVIWRSGASLGSAWTTYSQAYCDPEGTSPSGPVRAYTYSLVEAGTVDVPAGQFDALRLRSTQIIGCGGDDNQIGYIYSWYAAGVGAVETEIPSLHTGAILSLVSWREPQVALEPFTWGTVKALYR